MSENNSKNDIDLNSLGGLIRLSFENLYESLVVPFQQMFSSVREAILGGAIDRLHELLHSVAKAIKEALDVDISDEEIQHRITAYETWGQYGWVLPPEAPFDLFDGTPCDRKEANRIAMQYCKAQNIEYVFSELGQMKYVRKSDLEEAKFCFDHKKYKSCTMMLFSMIDARLIRLSTKHENERQPPSGNRAAQRLISHIKQEYDSANYLFMVLRLTGLQSCYDCIFSSGRDFKTQVPNINRNFIDHGMRWKKVTRTECIQVLLLYYETIAILDFLNVKRIKTNPMKSE